MPRVPSPRPAHRRPFRRRAWTLTITSALLAVAWVGSMMVGAGVTTSRGILQVFAGTIDFQCSVPSRSLSPDAWTMVRPRWNVRWWFGSEDVPLVGGGTLSVWHAPLWPFVLLTGVPGVWMLIKSRKHTNPHACPACGYDTTGLPQSQTGPAPCPECGMGKDENK